MTEITLDPTIISVPDIDHIETENDTPVDNLFSAKQQRLLVEPLYTSWKPEQKFLADANVGIFRTPYTPPIVPDMFLSLDVEIAENWYAKENRTYFLWEFGKPPDVVIEIVSNKKGREDSRKLNDYARLGVWYYIIYDPQHLIQPNPMQVYELHVGEYIPKNNAFLDRLGIGLALWQGVFEAKEGEWLRWFDAEGSPLPTGAELAEQERNRAEQERNRAEREQARAERLAAQLRALGIEPQE